MKSLALRLALMSGLFIATYTLIATQVFLRWSGLLSAQCGSEDCFTVPVYQWWFYLIDYWTIPDPLIYQYLVLGATGGVAVAGFLLFALYRLRTRRPPWPLGRGYQTEPVPGHIMAGSSDNHGHARWATPIERRELWPGPAPVYGGVVVGEDYDPRADRGPFRSWNTRTWGRGGRAPLLVDPCYEGSTHSMLIAGSGSFKTQSAITTICHWRGSAVVLDPAAELGPILAEDRRRMGHHVHILDPKQKAGKNAGFNVLDWIDFANNPVASSDVDAVVDWVCGYLPRSASENAHFFKNLGKSIVTCLLTHMLYDPQLPQYMKTLKTLRQALACSEGQMRARLEGIYHNSPAQRSRDLAGPLYQMVKETFGGAMANATQDTAWLSNPTYANMVSGNSFSAKDIVDGKTDVFLSLRIKDLDATPEVARCIIGALLNAAYEADGAVNGRILFLLDEAARLGYMKTIETARDAGRKYGLTLCMYYQSSGQIERQFGREGKASWFESLSSRSYAAVKDLATAREISESCGTFPVVRTSQSYRRRFSWALNTTNVTYTEGERRLIRPEEIMHDLRADAQIIVPHYGFPVLCGRAISFRRPEIVARLRRNRFTRGPSP
jgi:type IV secretion system protein VirD4